MDTAFKQNLLDIRKFLGLSQSELAKRIGWQPSHISHFESGRRLPSVQNLIKLARALGVSTDRLCLS